MYSSVFSTARPLLKAAALSVPMGTLSTLWQLKTAMLREQWGCESPLCGEAFVLFGKDLEKCGSYQMVDLFLGTVLGGKVAVVGFCFCFRI